MNYCPFCGKKLLPEADFCLSCGKELPKYKKIVNPQPEKPKVHIKKTDSKVNVMLILYIVCIAVLIFQIIMLIKIKNNKIGNIEHNNISGITETI